jgi:hypothetical protein
MRPRCPRGGEAEPALEVARLKNGRLRLCIETEICLSRSHPCVVAEEKALTV